MTTAPDVTRHVTCLGCGCLCDDIEVVVHDGQITDARNACALGRRWFGTGVVPATIRVRDAHEPLHTALSAASRLVRDATRPLVYVSAGVASEGQRAAAAIADMRRGRLDTITSATVLDWLLVTQERGFASATLGEMRHRADLIVVWGANVTERYPRLLSRYAAPERAGSRQLLAIDIGGARAAVEDASRRVAIEPGEELATLSALTALVRDPPGLVRTTDMPGHGWEIARELAPSLAAARYTALVFDAEPDPRAPRSPLRFDALTALAQALNDRSRCAAFALRAGGNRSGADAVLTAQAGYPTAIDFAAGTPRYAPQRAAEVALAAGEIDLALILGDPSALTPALAMRVGDVHRILIGPRASEAGPARGADVVIDTGIDGIHGDGTAVRLDDVPLPLRRSLAGPPTTSDVVRGLAALVRRAEFPGVAGVGTARGNAERHT